MKVYSITIDLDKIGVDENFHAEADNSEKALIVGMHQVDNNQELSQNFAKDLENELNRLEHRVKQAKRFKFSTFGLVFGVAVVFLFFVYNQCLDKVYNIEQRMKLEAQGDTGSSDNPPTHRYHPGIYRSPGRQRYHSISFSRYLS